MPSDDLTPPVLVSVPRRLAEPTAVHHAHEVLDDPTLPLAPRAALAELSELELALVCELARRGLAALRGFEAHSLPNPNTLPDPTGEG